MEIEVGKKKRMFKKIRMREKEKVTNIEKRQTKQNKTKKFHQL